MTEEERDWLNILKLAATCAIGLLTFGIGTCAYHYHKEIGTCYVETYQGQMYVRRREASGPDLWGPKVDDPLKAAEVSKAIGCELK